MPSKKLKSPGVRRVMAGLTAVMNAGGVPVAGRFVQFGSEDAKHAVVVGVCPAHAGNADYLAVFPKPQET